MTPTFPHILGHLAIPRDGLTVPADTRTGRKIAEPMVVIDVVGEFVVVENRIGIHWKNFKGFIKQT